MPGLRANRAGRERYHGRHFASAMGNNDFGSVGGRGKGKDDVVRFVQSKSDFPLAVSLGSKKPRWALNRWAGDGGLAFRPTDDEGYSIRGGGKRLVYKGRKRSHRFTILSDDAFEYDCILLREPESNIITLHMDGAERYDFFRQPDFIEDPLLAGSYAVYKKEVLVGEGTGKLCHIHSPEIIDAKGRRCWGDLSVNGDRLEIAVPEEFLSGAAYPVVVDPVIGTATVGRQTHHFDRDGYHVPLFFEMVVGVNRFTVPSNFNGLATAFVYAYNADFYGRCQPMLFSDTAGLPRVRRSMSEGLFDIQVRNWNPEGWRSATFRPNASIAGGGHVWFGLFCDYFAPRFDFGAVCYADSVDNGSHAPPMPDIYPLMHPRNFRDFRLSMYFTYAAPQNHVRTIFQGVSARDLRGGNAVYRRMAAGRVQAAARVGRFRSLHRRFVEAVRATDRVSFSRSLARAVREIVGVVNARARRFLSLSRRVAEAVRATDRVSFWRSLARHLRETVGVVNSRAGRFLSLSRRAVEAMRATDRVFFSRSMVRVVREIVGIVENGVDRTKGLFRRIGDNVRAHDGVFFWRSMARAVCETVGIIENGVDRVKGLFRRVGDNVLAHDGVSFWRFLVRAMREMVEIVENKIDILKGLFRGVGDNVRAHDGISFLRFLACFVHEAVGVVENGIDRLQNLLRRVDDKAVAHEKSFFSLSMFRLLNDAAKIIEEKTGRFLTMPRRVYDVAHDFDKHFSSLFIVRFVGEMVKIVETKTKRVLGIYLKIIDNIRGLDKAAFSLSMVRFMRETARISDAAKGSAAFFRGLSDAAKATGGVMRKWFYVRRLNVLVGAKGFLSRKLSALVRLFSKAAAMDSLVGRRFMPRGKLVLKSKIVRTVVLDSKIK